MAARCHGPRCGRSSDRLGRFPAVKERLHLGFMVEVGSRLTLRHLENPGIRGLPLLPTWQQILATASILVIFSQLRKGSLVSISSNSQASNRTTTRLGGAAGTWKASLAGGHRRVGVSGYHVTLLPRG